MLVCLFPIMTLMWLSTTLCVVAIVPKMKFIPALIIASCVTSTDPVLSQAVAKGPFSDKYVARPLREIISAEAGANDGFASPFFMLGVSLIFQYAKVGRAAASIWNVGDVMRYWVVEALLYIVLLAIAYGAVVGICARKVVECALSRKWMDAESYLLFPTALGVSVRQLTNGVKANSCSSSWLELVVQSARATCSPASSPDVC